MQSCPLPKLQNVVATCQINVAVDLHHLALNAKNVEYRPHKFSAVIMRIRNPRVTALIFRTGKLVVTGATSREASYRAARRFVRVVQKLYPMARFTDFEVQNVVGSVTFPFKPSLLALLMALGAQATYEPELFPGLTYRMTSPKAVMLIFASGKAVVTGAKHESDMKTAVQKAYPIIAKYLRM